MKKLLFVFALIFTSCGDPCSCEYLSSDPFNSSTLPHGCGCLVEKLHVPDIGVDIAEEVTGTKAADIYAAHKLTKKK